MKYAGNALAILILSVLFMGHAPAAAASDKHVRMAYLQNDIHHLALWVALEKDFFGKEGVSVEVAGDFQGRT